MAQESIATSLVYIYCSLNCDVNSQSFKNLMLNFMFDPVVMFARKQYLLSLFLYTLHRIQHQRRLELKMVTKKQYLLPLFLFTLLRVEHWRRIKLVMKASEHYFLSLFLYTLQNRTLEKNYIEIGSQKTLSHIIEQNIREELVMKASDYYLIFLFSYTYSIEQNSREELH